MKKLLQVLCIALLLSIFLIPAPAHASSNYTNGTSSKSGFTLNFSRSDLFSLFKGDGREETIPKDEKDLHSWWDCWDWTSWWTKWCKDHDGGHWDDHDSSYNIWKKYYCG
ncbi:hypothetical protein [Metabacillus sp. RGM 3146]|uniref:hypothetical protein n=1 Tax=Metabacillus sp. RGM 3146 TaxID=3401092 RepID=UPI003B9B7F18